MEGIPECVKMRNSATGSSLQPGSTLLTREAEVGSCGVPGLDSTPAGVVTERVYRRVLHGSFNFPIDTS